MSLVTALECFQRTMIIDTLPTLGEGLPESAPNAARNYFFLLQLDCSYEWDALQKVEATSSTALMALIFGLHRDKVPSGSSWFVYPNSIGESIVKRIAECNLSGTYKNDGDRGFYAFVRSWRTNFDPDKPECEGRVNVELGAFAK